MVWGIAFVFYALNIFLRLNIDEVVVNNFVILAFVFYLIGYFMFFAGIGILIDRLYVLLLSGLSFPVITLILFLFYDSKFLSTVISILPYLIISLTLLIINRRYSVDLNLLSVGWLMLFLINMGWVFNLITSLYVEITAIYSKIIIFFGMREPEFSLLVDNLKKFLIQGLAEVNDTGELDDLVMIRNQGSTSRVKQREVEWIKDTIEDYLPGGIRTILISVYNVLSVNDLRSVGVEEEDLYFVKMVSGGSSRAKVFDDYSMQIQDDLDDLIMLLSDIFSFSSDRNISCSIILFNLSNLIHTHGWKRVYSLIISTLPKLRSSKVNLTCFYYPETHEKLSNIHKFEKLADATYTI